MAAIIAEEDVAETLKKAVEVELTSRGFRLSGGGIAVAAELDKFYSDFKSGFWSGSAVAEVTMNVQVKKADGSIGFSKRVTGGGGVENLQLASGSNAKIALDAALRDAVSQLFSDAGFIDALVKAANKIDGKSALSDQQKAKEYIVVAYKSLIEELTKNEKGEYVRSLLHILKIPDAQQADAITTIRALSEAYKDIPIFADRVVEMFLK